MLESLLARPVEHATLARPIVVELPPELSQAESDDPLPTGHPYETMLAFQVWSTDGKLLVKSRSAPAERLGFSKAGFLR
ncbi:MAG: hypothetical protein HC848_06160 [Limnobacter sp.]|nr:hypothetical protein [Limnobacter sp.]